MPEPIADCLDEDEVLAFVDGALGSEPRRRAAKHVDECEVCRGLAAELARESDRSIATVQHARPPETGDLVAERFRLANLLGRGATGAVFRALDEAIGTEVAIKLLRIDSTRKGCHGVGRELSVGRRIAHPNVCRLFDAGVTGDREYITMELVEGDTLAELLAREEFPRARALQILAEIASGLSAAHALGIVHRDLKPANILIERTTGRVVLTDFGLATDLETLQSRRLVGTPAYWAPEQARGEPATPACDVYALGVIAYRLLCRRPFSLSERDAHAAIPREHRSAVLRCLAARPADRFANAAQAGAALALRRRLSRPWFWFIPAAAAIALPLVALYARPPSASAGRTTAGETSPILPPYTESSAATPSFSTAAEPPTGTPSLSSATIETSAHRSVVVPKRSTALPPSAAAESPSGPPPPAVRLDLLYRE